MRIKFKRGKQREILEKAILKAGSERKLKEILDIPNQTINHYRNELINISEDRLNLVLNFLKSDRNEVEKFIEKKLKENWGREKGGTNLIRKYKDSGNYDKYLSYLKIRGRKIFVKLHNDMKNKNPEIYYKTQYERFKKVGEYKCKTKNGEIVRNDLEKDTADFLYSIGLKYKYEPYVRVNGSVYFPDFRVGNLILECTAWRGYLKIKTLKNKLRDFEKEGFNVRFIIPVEIKKFYKSFDDKIITDLRSAPVAQIIRYLSNKSNGRAIALY